MLATSVQEIASFAQEIALSGFAVAEALPFGFGPAEFGSGPEPSDSVPGPFDSEPEPAGAVPALAGPEPVDSETALESVALRGPGQVDPETVFGPSAGGWPVNSGN